MFEREIQYYLTRGAELAEGRGSVTLAEIVSNPLLPQRLRAYFRAEAVRLLDEEQAHRASSRFDHAAPEIHKLERRLDELLRHTAMFRRDEYLDTLERAVKINFNYLCRPQLTLRSFVFRGEDAVSVPSAISRILYFDDYPYLTFVLKKWMEKKQREEKLEQITTDEFERIVRKIDDQALQSFTVADLQSLLTPMFAWIAEAGDSSRDVIPTDAFIMFFDDKNIIRLSDRLAQMQDAAPDMNIPGVCGVVEAMLNENIDIKENEAVREPERADEPYNAPAPPSRAESQTAYNSGATQHNPIVSDQTLHTNAVATEPSQQHDAHPGLHSEMMGSLTHSATDTIELAEAEEYDDDDDINDEQDDEVLGSSVASSIDTIDATEQKNTDHQTEEFIGAVPEISSDGEDAIDDSGETRTAEPTAHFSDRNSEFKIIGGTQYVASLPDIRTLIEDDDRKKLIKKIFRRNGSEYEKALDALNAMQTWKEASSYIDTLFLRNGVDPYVKSAIKFTDLVYSRFIKTPQSGSRA